MAYIQQNVKEVQISLPKEPLRFDDVRFSAPNTFAFFADLNGLPPCLLTVSQDYLFLVNKDVRHNIPDESINAVGRLIMAETIGDVKSAENPLKNIWQYAEEKKYGHIPIAYERRDDPKHRRPFPDFRVYNPFPNAKIDTFNVTFGAKPSSDYFEIVRELNKPEVPKWLMHAFAKDEYARLLGLPILKNEEADDSRCFLSGDNLSKMLESALFVFETIDGIAGEQKKQKGLNRI